MSKDSFAQSAAYLKQAVPLMIKYQIPTTPNNYHLWYSYVSGDMPELNHAVDQAIKQQGTFSLTTCERLYHQHLAAQDEQQMEAMMGMAVYHQMASPKPARGPNRPVFRLWIIVRS